MADTLEAALEPLRTYLRSIAEPRARFDAIVEVGSRIKRDELQTLAHDLRDEGKTWKEIGQIMGGVSYQRAFQYGKGE